MTTIKMPLSSAPLHPGDIIQHGLQHIVHHNANSMYPEPYHDEGVHLYSNHGSPAPMHDDGYAYPRTQPRYSYQQHGHQDSGLGMHYDNFSTEYRGGMYQDYGTPHSGSPGTPSMSSQEMMRTRSGYGAPRSLKPMPDGRSRSEKSPKVKKTKKEKTKPEKKVAKLEKPLSELTKDWTHVPVADIDTYVNRSAEERRREVEEGKIPGKVKRPMNSFMLYRKAYQNRTKDWCLQNNHQVVSQVCGDSWPLEPDEIKDQFNEWARIERQNHQNAHPGYKFSPTKPGATKAPKRKMSVDVASEESDLDDFDWQGGPHRRSKKSRPSPRPPQSVPYPITRSAYHYTSREHSVEPNMPNMTPMGYNKSSYHMNNPGRPMPPQYNPAALGSGEYYQQSTHNSHAMPGVQDVMIRKAPAPGVHSFLGLPGSGQEYEMINQYPQHYEAGHDHGGGHGGEHRVDPSLIPQEQLMYSNGAYGEQHPDGVYFGGSHNGEGQWHGAPYMMEHAPPVEGPVNGPYLDPELDNAQIHEQHAHVLRGAQEGWHSETLDAGEGAFDKWMDDHE